MADRCLLYYITDRKAFAGSETARRSRLLEKIAQAARCRVDYVQLREKDLPARELEILANEAVRIIRENSKREAGEHLATDRWLRTTLLINSRTDVALAVGARGVHLRSDDVSPADVRKVWTCGTDTPARMISPRYPVIAVSCHSPEEVTGAASQGASFAVFGPVFEKKDAPAEPAGLDALRNACCAKIPVLALGGVTLENARSCLEAGAAGIAAIRLFQENDILQLIRHLR